ncbi:hypothetical protein FRB95_000682 [Tulasnella sp. JGI-2019a]|nr:hypothetical protein FRB95_000682 [Tulasnella sp. JGI-2019a]
MVAQIYGWAITEEFVTELARKQDIGTESQREDDLTAARSDPTLAKEADTSASDLGVSL